MESEVEKAYREEIELTKLVEDITSKGKYTILRGTMLGEYLIIVRDLAKGTIIESIQDIEEMPEWERESKGIFILKCELTERKKVINFILDKTK